ncbi:MAG: hypothetical protein AAFO91_18440, partial [Bacteroidota bacterium]
RSKKVLRLTNLVCFALFTVLATTLPGLFKAGTNKAHADTPYSQSSYYSQGTYGGSYSQGSYGGKDGNGTDVSNSGGGGGADADAGCDGTDAGTDSGCDSF